MTFVNSQIPEIFNESQKSAVSHRKYIAQLRKVLYAAPKTDNGLDGFCEDFISCVNCILAVKKKEAVVERCIKFISHFISFLQQKDAANADDMESSLENEFTRFFLIYLLNGLQAKDKVVRLRSCQMLANCIDNIEEIDDDLFERLRDNLCVRTRDKEAPIRAQAIIALSKFQDSEDDNEDEVKIQLLFSLKNDPSAAVRKAALANIEVTKMTIPYIVERTRDVDPSIRKYVYSVSMKEIGDFRVFSIADRELILSWGLKDRDVSVKKACVQMLCDNWIHQCEDNVLQFLSRLDVINSDIAETCLTEFLKLQSEFDFSFDGTVIDWPITLDFFWDNLSPETALFMFSYLSYQKRELSNEDAFPEITIVAVQLQAYLNKLITTENEDYRIHYEYICHQILRVALLLDFSDEVGRQNMNQLLISFLTKQVVQDNLDDMFDLLRKVSANEADFLQAGLEIIGELREELEDDGASDLDELAKNIESLSLQDDEGNLKLGILCRALMYMENIMKRVHLSLEDHPELMEFLVSMVIPSLKGTNPSLQMLSMNCMLQYCLVDSSFARQNLEFLVNALDGSPSIELQDSIFKALFDIVMSYGFSVFEDSGVSQRDFIKLCTRVLDECDDANLKTTIIEGCSKVFAFRDLASHSLMSRMLEVYFCCDAATHEKMIQVLTFFFPYFCSQSLSNKHFLAMSFAKTFLNVVSDESQVPATQIVSQMLNWITPETVDANENVSCLDVCSKVIKVVTGHPSATVKAGLQFVNKLYLGKLQEDLKQETEEALDDLQNEISDKASLTLLEKFKLRLEPEQESPESEQQQQPSDDPVESEDEKEDDQ